ncbi:transposase [candidate division KSB1 bacterium]|nr:transposase [candidate division KSB1 bacterium]
MIRRHQQISQPGSVHFVTTVTQERGRWFVDPEDCRELLWAFERARHRLGVTCMGFVLMPDHIHALLQQTEPDDQISELLRSFKQSTTQTLRRCIRVPPVQASTQNRSWRRRFDDVAVLTNDIARVKLGYIHGNPVKRGLCEAPEAYAWSSARDYLGTPNGIVDVDTALIGF